MLMGRGVLSLLLLTICLVPPPTAYATLSIALGYTPKYPPTFDHFAYVEPNAPKGGNLVLAGFGSFDKLNPFTLKRTGCR